MTRTALGKSASTNPPVEQQPELGQLGSSLGFLLRMSQVEVFDMFFDALGGLGLKPGQFSILWVVHLNPGVRQGTVADTLKIKPAHMTKMIRTYEETGLIERNIPAQDRRGIELRLTDAGDAFVAEHAENFFSYFRNDAHGLSEKETDQLVVLLKKFIRSGAKQ